MIYSPSVSLATEYTCSFNKDRTTAHCWTSTLSGTNARDWACVKDDAGAWHCEELTSSTNVPPAIKDAIVKAKAGATTGENDNNTKALNGNVMKGGSTLKKGGIDNNAPTNSNDTLQ